MIQLILSIIVLFAGAAIYRFCHSNRQYLEAIDGFIFVSIGGLVAFHLLPEAFSEAGVWAVAFAILGLIGPTLTERMFHKLEGSVHFITLLMAVIGLLLHTLLDGAALSEMIGQNESSRQMLTIGILLHRLPVGLTLWWLVRPRYGIVRALVLLILMAICTVGGYSIGTEILHSISGNSMALFQALVSGSLFHVVIHRPHMGSHQCCGHDKKSKHEGIGNLLGLILLFFMFQEPWHVSDLHQHGSGHMEMFLILLKASAPALIFGYIIAAWFMRFGKQGFVSWMNKGSSLQQALRGMLVGLPIPVCSCGVVPLYESLVKRGAGTAAAVAFLIATPELGIDAVLISLPLLGGKFTLYRVFAAMIMAAFVGWLMGKWMNGKNAQPMDIEDEKRPTFSQALYDLAKDTVPWVAVGLAIASLIAPLEGWAMPGWLSNTWDVPFFALVGIPIYICASGMTPIVAVLIATSISPGAGLALILTGPATNVTTFGVLKRLHGKNMAVLFALLTISISIGLGYLTNAFIGSVDVIDLAAHEHAKWGWIDYSSVGLLALLVIILIYRNGMRSLVSEVIRLEP